MLSIDKNVEIPERKNVSESYPWKDMEIGDSFFVVGVSGREFTGRAYYAGKKYDRKFAVRSVEGGCRCWRVKKEEN